MVRLTHLIVKPEFDYIIIGGGNSGCLLANRLASSAARPSVLLVEAGGEAEDDIENLIPGLVVPKYGNKNGNWVYETAPQKALNGRTIVYPRGKGLGGSSAVNFSSWCRGPKCDWDEWADLVDDDWWRWDNVVEYMRKIEDFNDSCPDGMKGKYVQAVEGLHYKGGPIGVGWGADWQSLIEPCLDGAIQANHKLNLDHNAGSVTGVSVAQMNVDHGERRSAAYAFLGPGARMKLDNLSIATNTVCKRILFEGKKATGVELLLANSTSDESTTVQANKEIILCAGAFETPHILLLSGIGPASQLSTHRIPLVHASPSIGQNMRDHAAFSIEVTISPSIAGHNQLLHSKSALVAAREQYTKHKTGPLAVFGASAVMLFTRIPDLLSSGEFSSLPQTTQDFLSHPDRPHTELWLHGGPLFYQGPSLPEDSILAVEGLCQNLQSRGSVTLASSNPREFPIIDPEYLTNEIDWRITIETIKVQLRLLQTPALRAIVQKPIHGPGKRDEERNLTLCEPDDEDAIRKFLREELTQGFHSMGSCVMGSEKNPGRVVDREFRVLGLTNLRIADMSICPILTNNHTQINAYLIAERCAQYILGDADEVKS